jgi:beta-glucosidase
MGGNVIMTNSWQDKVRAILFAYYPGMEGGTALADIIYGKVNPSGKLPFAIAKKEDSYPKIRWWALKQHYGYYHGYQKIDKDGKEYDFPFGYGLSYTAFSLDGVKLKSTTKDKAKFCVTVTNTGERRGAEVLQLYVGWNGSAVDRPVRVLRDFEKIWLDAGESREVILSVKKDELGFFDEKKNAFVFEDIEYTAYIGTDEVNCTERAIKFTFNGE